MYAEDRLPYRIAICDDEKIFLNDAYHKIKEALDKNDIPFIVDGFLNPENLIRKGKEAPDIYDIIFLDIMMKDYNGIKVAKVLRRFGVNSIIIFITVTKDFVLKGYEVEAFRYLLKPIDTDELTTVLLLCHKNLIQKREHQLVLALGEITQRVFFEDITYIEVKGRGTALFLKTETILSPYKITDMENRARKSLLHRCHQSFMVNLAYIKQIKRYEIQLTTGCAVPVSKAYFQKIKDAFLAYLANK